MAPGQAPSPSVNATPAPMQHSGQPNLPSLPNQLPSMLTKRKVVLPEGLSGHHTVPHHPDPWHQWEGFVVILVLLHIAVLSFYAWVLWKDRRDKRDKRRAGGGTRDGGKAGGGGGGKAGAGAGGSPGGAGAAAAMRGAWRTPKDILQKQRLGKV